MTIPIASHRRRHTLRILPCYIVGLVIFLGLSLAAFGDGCYISERAVKKIPEISSQRAVLSWKDNVETLVISSALDSKSQKLGWIIPLPSVPESIEKQSPGGLKTLDFCLQPRITHDLQRDLSGTFLAVFLSNLILGTFLFERKSLLPLLLIIFGVFVFVSLLLPASSSGAKAAKSSLLKVEKTVSVGSYDISILKAMKLADLTAWLDDNQFASMPPGADKIIDEYISQGWVFATVKLARAESGENAPHPLQMRFPAKETVYPMKLTSIAGGRPEFELFVIANEKASCQLLSEVFCDRFTIDKDDNDPNYKSQMLFIGSDSGISIGHPAITPLMWDNCVLTQFAGSIDAAAMSSDIKFSWIPFAPSRQHFYTEHGAMVSIIILFLAWGGTWLFVTMLYFEKKIRQPGGLQRYLLCVLLPAFVVIASCAVVIFLNMPKLANTDVQITRGGFHKPQSLHWHIKDLIQDRPEIFQGSEQEIAEAIQKNLTTTETNHKPRLNDITGKELNQEDSPGNFTVEKKDGEIILRVYDYDGSAATLKYPPRSSE